MHAPAATPVLVTLTDSGDRVVLGVHERSIAVCCAYSNAELNRFELPHRIRAVFAAAGQDVRCSRVFVVVDGPEPVLEVDYMCSSTLAVVDGETKQPFLARGTSDVRLDYMRTSDDGHHVTVAFTDGMVSMYRVESTHGKPTFTALDTWTSNEEARVVGMVFAGAGDALPAYIVALMVRENVPPGKCATFITRFAVDSRNFLREFQADVGAAVSISSVPDDPNLVALFLAGAEPTVCYLDVQSVAMHCSLKLGSSHGASTSASASASLVALQGGTYGKYAVIVADGGHAVLVTGDDTYVRETNLGTRSGGGGKDEDGCEDRRPRSPRPSMNSCWRTLPAGGSTAALTCLARPPMFIDAQTVMQSG